MNIINAVINTHFTNGYLKFNEVFTYGLTILFSMHSLLYIIFHLSIQYCFVLYNLFHLIDKTNSIITNNIGLIMVIQKSKFILEVIFKNLTINNL